MCTQSVAYAVVTVSPAADVIEHHTGDEILARFPLDVGSNLNVS